MELLKQSSSIQIIKSKCTNSLWYEWLNNYKKTKLSYHFIDIEPSMGGKPEPLAVLISEELYLDKENLNEPEKWLDVLKNLFGHIEEWASLSGFYSRHSSSKSLVSVNPLFPILPESINTSPTVRYCAKIIVKLTKKLHPGQIPIITADQPVYALGQQVQWLYPHELDNIIWMMGPLHTGMIWHILKYMP